MRVTTSLSIYSCTPLDGIKYVSLILSCWCDITISGICTSSGHVKMMLEEDINGFLVSDHLTDMLAYSHSKNVDLFSDNEKQELIYKERWR